MQKQSNFFEQNVQWIALGLGGVFLLLMVYFYVLQQPVAVTVDGKTLGPGEVEPATLQGPVEAVKRDIRDTSIPNIEIRDYVSSFVATIQGTKDQPIQLAGTQIHSGRDTGIEGPQGPTGGPGQAAIIAKLPEPPAPQPLLMTKGRSRIEHLDPKWIPDERRPNEVHPIVQRDIDWVSASFTISGRELAKAFAAAFDAKKLEEAGRNPAQLMQTQVIDVELIRQEILPGEKAGETKTIPPIKANLDRPPFPGKNAPEIEIQTYLSWATQNPDEVKMPLFYTVIAGEVWREPNEENEKLAREELKLAREDRIARQAQRNQENQARREQLRQRRNPQMTEDFDMPEDVGLVPGRQPFRPQPAPRPAGVPLRPGQAARQPVQVDAGKFDVNAEEDILLIVHDETIEPGKRYRYKIRYRLFNPTYRTVRIATRELADQFAIVSKDSAWTKPITVRPKVEFFLAKINGDRSDFDIFQMREGQMKKTRVTAGPGDAIGTSGWSVVDVRGTGLKAYSLLMDEIGQVVRREPEGANPSDRYFNLLEEAEMPPAAVGLR